MSKAKEICEKEAEMLSELMNSIPKRERRHFITRVIEKAHLPRRHWYNWAYALSRMPEHVKLIIEREAHKSVFTLVTAISKNNTITLIDAF